MINTTTIQTIQTIQKTQKATPDFIYVIYDIDEVYVRDCKTLSEVADFFKVSKQALANHLRRTGQNKSNFKYKNYSIEYFDRNDEDC